MIYHSKTIYFFPKAQVHSGYIQVYNIRRTEHTHSSFFAFVGFTIVVCQTPKSRGGWSSLHEDIRSTHHNTNFLRQHIYTDGTCNLWSLASPKTSFYVTHHLNIKLAPSCIFAPSNETIDNPRWPQWSQVDNYPLQEARCMKSHPTRNGEQKQTRKKKSLLQDGAVIIYLVEPYLSTNIYITASLQNPTEYGVHGIRSPY